MNCLNCRAELPPGARFCMNCGQPVNVSNPADQARLSRLAAAAPAMLVEKVRAAARFSGERRLVTALFLDIVSSTRLAEQLGSEKWARLLNGALDRLTPVIYLYEGTIAHLVQDELLAFFGAPVAHEDDPVRAVRAALDLLEIATQYATEVQERFGVDFALRISISTGPVILGPVGNDLKYEYSALHGSLNLAGYLEAAKLQMTVLVSEDTHRFIEPFFETSDLGHVEVQGLTAPVHMYQVLGARGMPGSLRGLSGLQSPMVGRERELETLMQLYRTVHAGLGRAVLVQGEPGLGKTRLIAEWKDAVIASSPDPTPQWIEGRCLSYGPGLAYHLLLSLVYSALGIQDPTSESEARSALMCCVEEFFCNSLEDVYPYLGHLLSIELEDPYQEQIQCLEPEGLQARYLDALRQLLTALADQKPLVLVLEDLHWADPSSVDVLVQLLPLASSIPVMFCLVARPERASHSWRLITAAREILGGGLTEITLEALSETDSRKLVTNLLQIDALSSPTRSLILQKAEGNPFFMEEVIRMLIDRGAITQEDGRWVAGEQIERVEIPDNLQGLLQARIDRLPEDVKHTLRVAAVIGRQFPVKVLEQVLNKVNVE